MLNLEKLYDSSKHNLKEYWYQELAALRGVAHAIKTASSEDLRSVVHNVAELARKAKGLSEEELATHSAEWFQEFTDSIPDSLKNLSETVNKRNDDPALNEGFDHHKAGKWIRDLFHSMHQKYHEIKDEASYTFKKDAAFIVTEYKIIEVLAAAWYKTLTPHQQLAFRITFETTLLVIQVGVIVALGFFCPIALPAAFLVLLFYIAVPRFYRKW